ncbi:MAG: ATP-binding protein [Candidatus Omnitrophica bacterium]|nr:ATP-binding protein [Candidatus Omnitrophota bacterium]
MIDIAQMIELDRLAREDGKKYRKRRFIFSKIANAQGKHYIGIVGPRGAGKTILLKQIALENKRSFYISLDTVRDDLFEIVKKIHQELKIDLFLLDEVHFHPSFEAGIKKIYDFLDVKVIFTSSVSLALFSSSYDLSRRITLEKLYPFSFHEYLFFKHDIKARVLTLKQVIKKEWDPDAIRHAQYFNDYLQGGVLPFSLDEPVLFETLKNIVTAVVRKDIPMVGRLSLPEVEVVEKLLVFVGKSGIDGINYSSLSKNLGITKYKAEQYVSLLERAFIFHRVFPKGTNVLKEPKILMALPYRLLYSEYEQALGGLCEDFFVEMLRSLGIDFYYLKSTRGAKTPDYLILMDGRDVIIEVGGKGKGRQQFKGIKARKKIIFSHSLETQGIKRPLFFLGMIDRVQ